MSDRVHRVQVVRDAQGIRVRREWATIEVCAVLGVDPSAEVAAQRLAAAHGLAPPVLEFDASRGVMWMPFVEGHALETDWVDRPPRLAAMRDLLERLQTIDAQSLPRIDPAERLAELFARLEKVDATGALQFAPAVKDALAAAGAMTDSMTSGNQGGSLVHGDLSCDNVIVRSDGSLCLIDWEYAHRGRADEDLAGLVASSLPSSALLASWSRAPRDFAVRVQIRRLLDAIWYALAARVGSRGSAMST